MKIGMALPLAISAPAIALLAACGASPKSNGPQGVSTTFAISGGDFSNNSVRICGSRMPPADSKFRCVSDLGSSDAGADAGGCPCFNFEPNGTLAGSGIISNLCPSIDTSAGAIVEEDGGAPWTFTYAIFNSPDCEGARLNDGTHNFTCFDSRNVATEMPANETTEILNPGLNSNQVLCATVNAQKSFNFLSCQRMCPGGVLASGQCTGLPITFSCGCTLAADGTCVCNGDAGPTAADLPDGCGFQMPSCDIACGEVVDAGVDAGFAGCITGFTQFMIGCTPPPATPALQPINTSGPACVIVDGGVAANWIAQSNPVFGTFAGRTAIVVRQGQNDQTFAINPMIPVPGTGFFVSGITGPMLSSGADGLTYFNFTAAPGAAGFNFSCTTP
jgi:hypothetical protein